MKLRVKIPLLFSVITASVIAVLSLFVYYFAGLNSFEDFYKRLEIRAIIAAKAAFEIENSDTRTYEDIRRKHLQILPGEEEYFLPVDTVTNTIQKHGRPPLPAAFYTALLYEGYATHRVKDRFYSGILYNGSGGKYVVIVSAENEYSKEYLRNLRHIFLIGFVISAAITFSFGLFFSKQIRNPIRRVTESVKDISSNNLHLRLKSTGNSDELGELVATFNNMLDRLETSFESQKNFISNASHELSTPLTAIIGEGEYALRKERDEEVYRNSLRIMLEEANRLKNITTSLISLAQTGFDGKKLNWGRLRVDEMLFSVLDTVHNIIPGSQINIDYSLFPEDESLLVVEGNLDLLHMALSNIIMNACKYSDNQPVTVALATGGNHVLIAVDDRGIGIPRNELKYIYDPFFRASNTSKYRGYGIGLPLARNIIRIHDGQLIVNSEEGKGTQVVVKIPVAGAPNFSA